MLFKVQDHFPGVKGLTTKLSRAIIMAPATYGTGIKVKQVLPSEVLDFGYAKGLNLFQIDGLKSTFRI
jgi:hypothetical protein